MAVTLCAAGIAGRRSNPFRFLTAGEREEASSVCAAWHWRCLGREPSSRCRT